MRNQKIAEGAIREHVLELLSLIETSPTDPTQVAAEVVPVVQSLIQVPGLDTMTAAPAWSSKPVAGQASAGWIYQDGEIRITRGTVPGGLVLPPHNHGTWNIFGVYSGAMKYRSYRRLDDRDAEYEARLEIDEDGVMKDGDVTVLPPPPHDIHRVMGLAEETTTLLIARNEFAPLRERYFPDQDCYMITEADPASYFAQKRRREPTP